MGPVGEYRLMPELDTFRVLPYAPHTGALLTDHFGLDGEPAAVCQRSFLKRMEARLAERGLTCAPFENEFSLATQRRRRIRAPLDSGAVLLDDRTTASQDYADELVAALEAQRIAFEQYYAELGHGQQEISTAARAGAAGGRRAAARARDDPRRRDRAAGCRLAGAEAVARQRGQRLPHPLLALGG